MLQTAYALLRRCSEPQRSTGTPNLLREGSVLTPTTKIPHLTAAESCLASFIYLVSYLVSKTFILSPKPLDHLVFRSTATSFLERAPGLLLDRFPFRKLELDWFWKVPTGTGLVLKTANWNWPAFEKWPKFDSKQPLLCKNLIKIANLPRFYELLVNPNINSATNQH